MGIDAEILIRYHGEKPTDAQLTRWSWELCSSVGARHFFTGDGLPHGAYKVASEAWHAAFKAHPDFPAYDRLTNRSDRWLIADDQERRNIHERILADVGKAPEQLRRAIDFSCATYDPDDWHDDDVPPTHRVPGLVWMQDGAAILAQPGEWLLKVSLWTRYYGVGYERGDILTICAVAEWIEANIPDSEVWYGGDSSGIEAEPFHAAKREELRRHLYSRAGRDYFAYSRNRASIQPAPCGLCIPGEPRFNEFGSGANYTAVSCGGCGKSFETRDRGATWTVKKDD